MAIDASHLSAVAVRRLPPRWWAAAIDLAHRRFEPELGRLSDFAPGGGTAVDVGAWYGPWTRALARRFDQVVALEPHPGVARALAATVPANVQAVPAAASDRPGTATLSYPPRAGGEGTAALGAEVPPGHQAAPVELVRLDDLDLAAVSFIKIDVEGHELAVLEGARTLLDRDRPTLLVEIEYRFPSAPAVLEHLATLGYRPEVLLDRRWQPLHRFDLAAHQAGSGAPPSYLQLVVSPQRYVRNVVFRPPPA